MVTKEEFRCEKVYIHRQTQAGTEETMEKRVHQKLRENGFASSPCELAPWWQASFLAKVSFLQSERGL